MQGFLSMETYHRRRLRSAPCSESNNNVSPTLSLSLSPVVKYVHIFPNSISITLILWILKCGRMGTWGDSLIGYMNTFSVIISVVCLIRGHCLTRHFSIYDSICPRQVFSRVITRAVIDYYNFSKAIVYHHEPGTMLILWIHDHVADLQWSICMYTCVY